jgi:hypothetical protein
VTEETIGAVGTGLGDVVVAAVWVVLAGPLIAIGKELWAEWRRR